MPVIISDEDYIRYCALCKVAGTTKPAGRRVKVPQLH